MKIKVLYTIPNFDTAGSGKALLNLAQGLDKNKFEAHIVCLHDKGAYFNVVKASGIPIHVIPFVSKARPIGKLFQRCLAVSKQFKKINPDIIHSFHYSADYTEVLAARLARIPWVFTKKNMSWGGSSANAWKLRSRLASAIAVQNTDMIKAFYPNSKKTKLIPRGVDTLKFKPQELDDTIRDKMQTSKEQRIVICVANMVPVKGVEILIDAFYDLSILNPHWTLWIVGDIENDYGEMLVSKVDSLSLDTSVKFSGKQADVRPYLDHAEIFVLPTKDKGRREGSPVAMLEAMANGKVVLGSAVPGIKDQLKDFPNHLFTAGSKDDLVLKLSKLMSNSILENIELGKIFKNLANKEFPIQLEIERHEELYKSTLKLG